MVKKVLLAILTLFLFTFSGCNSNGKGDCNIVVEVKDLPVDCNLTYDELLKLGKVCDKPNNPPKITSYESNSTNIITIFENDFDVTKVLATDLEDSNLTYLLSGVDSNLFKIENTKISFKVSPDFENPTDSNKDNVYEVTLIVSDSKGAKDSVNFKVEVLNKNENTTPIVIAEVTTPIRLNIAPTITNYGTTNMLSINENIVKITTINAIDLDGDTVSFSLLGSDMDKFNITQDGELSFIVAPNFESPLDSNGDNIYEVTVVVEDKTSSTEAKFLIVINNVDENNIIPMEIGKEYEVKTGDRVEVLTTDTVINVVHTLNDDTKVVTLLSGSANLIRGDYEIKE